MCAGVLETDHWTKHTDAPTIVLPAPALNSAAGTVFKVHLCRGRRADSKYRTAAPVDAVRELNENRVVAPEVVVRFAANPQSVIHACVRIERHLEIVGWVRERRAALRSAVIRIRQA